MSHSQQNRKEIIGKLKVESETGRGKAPASNPALSHRQPYFTSPRPRPLCGLRPLLSLLLPRLASSLLLPFGKPPLALHRSPSSATSRPTASAAGHCRLPPRSVAHGERGVRRGNPPAAAVCHSGFTPAAARGGEEERETAAPRVGEAPESPRAGATWGSGDCVYRIHKFVS